MIKYAALIALILVGCGESGEREFENDVCIDRKLYTKHGDIYYPQDMDCIPAKDVRLG